MKLLTHNMLTSNIIKGVTKGFPLGIAPKRVEVQEVDFNPDFITRILPKLDFTALRQAAEQVEVLEGDLVCPETGRKFPIQNGIPNMLLNEDEVS